MVRFRDPRRRLDCYANNLSLEPLELRHLLTVGFSSVQVLSADDGDTAAWGDFNNDGFVDLQAGGSGLWQNNGGANFTFNQNGQLTRL